MFAFTQVQVICILQHHHPHHQFIIIGLTSFFPRFNTGYVALLIAGYERCQLLNIDHWHDNLTVSMPLMHI
jgi:hypothetical protein